MLNALRWVAGSEGGYRAEPSCRKARGQNVVTTVDALVLVGSWSAVTIVEMRRA